MPKPRTELSSAFGFVGVADAYRARPPYPTETVERLATLAGEQPVLDLGAGEGALARPLAARVSRVDAVEISSAMVNVGRTLDGGDRPNLHWHIEAAEDFTPTGPFGLVVAGDAMHWFDLDAVVGRVGRILLLDAPLAIVARSARQPGLAAVDEVIRRHSRAPEYDPSYSVSEDLAERGLWHSVHEATSEPVEFRQSANDYLLSLRSTASLARELMSDDENAAFDQAILRIAATLTGLDGLIRFTLTSRIVWGTLA